MRKIQSLADLAQFYHGLAERFSGALIEDLVRAVYEADGILPKDGWAIDGGANRGLHTFPLAARCERVIAFEPRPDWYRTLTTKLVAEKQNNVTLLEMALSDRTENRIFYSANVPGGSALTIYPGTEDVKRINTTVLSVKLDDILKPDRLDFIKLDLDGYDFFALKGAKRLLQEHRPVVAFEFGREFTANAQGYTADEFFSFFENVNYDLYDICGVPFSPAYWSRSIWMPWDMIAVPHGRDTRSIRESIDARLQQAGFEPRF